jgi:hypothetical protein
VARGWLEPLIGSARDGIFDGERLSGSGTVSFLADDSSEPVRIRSRDVGIVLVRPKAELPERIVEAHRRALEVSSGDRVLAAYMRGGDGKPTPDDLFVLVPSFFGSVDDWVDAFLACDVEVDLEG